MESIGQLTGGIAHDFNNLLSVLASGLEVLTLGRGGSADSKTFDSMRRAVDRGATLTQQLLAFARQQPLLPETRSVNRLVSGFESVLRRAVNASIEFTVKLEPQVRTTVIDSARFESAILNLVVNARDAMPDGGTVTVRTFSVSANDVRDMKNEIMPIGDYTGLSVGDTGVGIAPEFLGKIFEPFYTTKAVGRGTGLGLSTVYGIIKQSGGFIFPESELGKGTVFNIYLPVHTAAAEPIGSATTTKKRPATETWGTGTILLVEDEDMVRTVAERALTRQGYTVITAADGEQGLARLGQSEKIDMVISDVVMPGMDGPTMVRAVRATHPDMPVLFMSGYAEEQLRKSIDIDDVAFLPKPFSVNQLAEAARDVLAAAREQAAAAQ
jgi:two-component system cell cycle sensor histidine kinase/response regulator CckA